MATTQTGQLDCGHRARALPAHAPDPRRRGPRPEPLPARRGLRHDASLQRAGGGRRRVRERARRGRPRRVHLPRARPPARDGQRPGGAARRAARPRDRGQRRPLGLDEHRRPGGRRARLLRHRRREHRRRDRRGARAARHRRVAVAYFGDGATTRPTSSSASTSQGARAAGRLRLREQRLRRVHAVRGGHGRRDPARARGDGHPDRADRRDGRLGDRACGGRARSSHACATAAGRSSSRRSPTASSATRAAIPASTGREGELDRWRERDPLVVLRATCSRRGRAATLDEHRGARSPRSSTRIEARRSRRRSRSRGLDPGVQRGRAPSTSSMPKLSDSMEEATVARAG